MCNMFGQNMAEHNPAPSPSGHPLQSGTNRMAEFQTFLPSEAHADQRTRTATRLSNHSLTARGCDSCRHGRLQKCIRRSPQPPVVLCALPTAARRPHVRLASCTEIGIGLTGAGLLFMVLGMMMFFDKGLLAMGNVRRVPSGPRLDLAALLCSRPPPLCVCRSCSLRVS